MSLRFTEIVHQILIYKSPLNSTVWRLTLPNRAIQAPNRKQDRNRKKDSRRLPHPHDEWGIYALLRLDDLPVDLLIAVDGPR